MLLEQNADPNATNIYGHTAFHTASQFRQESVARLLVKSGACRKTCATCRNYMQELKKKDRQLQSERDKEREERARAEQELRNFDIIHELQKAREDLGGPFFDEAMNRKYH